LPWNRNYKGKDDAISHEFLAPDSFGRSLGAVLFILQRI
jgi:hypothetical protein